MPRAEKILDNFNEIIPHNGPKGKEEVNIESIWTRTLISFQTFKRR